EDGYLSKLAFVKGSLIAKGTKVLVLIDLDQMREDDNGVGGARIFSSLAEMKDIDDYIHHDYLYDHLHDYYQGDEEQINDWIDQLYKDGSRLLQGDFFLLREYTF
ncbi:MAG: hypothetical protein ACMG6E_06555, partial [Candidatus Roizmanbacteria bacterium]